MRLHIVTGGSKGLGAGIVQALSQVGDHCVVIGRTAVLDRAGVKGYRSDLFDQASIPELMRKILIDHPLKQYSEVSLVNNAAVVGPIGPTESLDAAQVQKNLVINLHAPMILMSEFLKQTRNFSGMRTILNVSSGVAARPKAYWGAYSAAKAGLEAFSKALEMEQSSDRRLRVLVFDPGIMDTGMQEEIRAADPELFPDVSRFIGYKKTGQLVDPNQVGQEIKKLLLQPMRPGR